MKFKYKDYTSKETRHVAVQIPAQGKSESSVEFKEEPYELKHTYKRQHYGLIAQEVGAALEKAALTPAQCGMWCCDQVGDVEEQGLRYDELIAPLIKAIQELTARVAALES